MKRHLLAYLLVTVLTTSLATAQNWTEFRGSDGNGDAGQAKIPVKLSESDNVRWKIPIPGRGWSSPVIWGDQLWVTTGTKDGKKLYGMCIDRHSGKIIHNLLLFQPEEPGPCHETNTYASSTPAIENGRVYLHFGSNGTACVDTNSGKVIWKQETLRCNHWRGAGSFPIIHGDLLLVAFDGFDVQYVAAINKISGKVVWKTDREIDYGTDNGDRKKAYSTGRVVAVGGKTQFISPSAVETISYEVNSGKELWRVRHGGMNAAARPLYGHGSIYIAAGSGQTSLIALKPDGSGRVSPAAIAWSSGKGVPHRPSQLLLGDHLYMLNDDGVTSCLNAKTGETLWKGRIKGQGKGSYRASLLHASGQIYAFALDGRVTVYKASPQEFQVVSDTEFENGFQASPAVAGDTLYLRSTKHLYCIGEKK